MAIPKQVQRQGTEAEKVRKGIYEDGKTPEELGMKPGEAPVAEDKPISDPEPAPKVEAPVAEDYKSKYEDLKHQFDVLKGKNDSEVPELVSVNRQMAGQLASLQGQVSDLTARLNKVPEKDTTPQVDPKQAEEIQSFSDNYPDIERGVSASLRKWTASDEFKSIVRSVVEEAVRGVSTQVDERIKKVETRVEKSAEEMFGEKMDGLVKDENGKPCWRQVNDDKEFATYLKSQKIHGTSKFELLRIALGRGDVEGVGEIFNEYLVSKNPALAKKPVENKEPKVAPTVEDVAPAKPGGGFKPKGGNGEDKAEPQITRSFIAKFHTDVALGRYKNRPKEREQLNAQINNAVAKGMVLNQ